jgi:hypothetical protein
MGAAPDPIQALQGEVQEKTVYKDENDIRHTEHVLSADPDVDEKDHMDYDRVDKEVAKYTSDTRVDISEEENTRLRRMIDKRVLVIIIFTYYKRSTKVCTLSFSAIMGIQTDTHIQGQQV